MKNLVLKKLRSVGTTERGKKSLIDASLRRKDGKDEIFTNSSIILFHEHCRKSYTRDCNIRKSTETGTVVQTPIKLRSSVAPSTEMKCIFCFENIPKNYEEIYRKQPVIYRNKVTKITTLEFKEKILKRATQRADDWGKKVQNFIWSTSDLIAADGIYHRKCYINFMSKKGDKNKPRGAPENTEIAAAMEKIFSFIDNSEECQFKISELYEIPQNPCFSRKTLLKKLKDRYKEKFFSTYKPGLGTLIFITDGGMDGILTDSWYKNRNCDPEMEKIRILQTAADIIRNDIRCQAYDTDHFPGSRNYLDGCESLVPNSLSCLLESIVLPGKKSETPYKKKCTAIAHCIIAATRPRSFISPIQTAIGMYLYRKVESQIFIDMLSNLGLSASYKDVRILETSSMMKNDIQLLHDSFVQFSFDNADFNSRTLDGWNTIHIMGGIENITPAASLQPQDKIEKITNQPKKDEISSLAHIPIQSFQKNGNAGLHSIKFENVDATINYTDQCAEKLQNIDVLWLLAKFWNCCDVGGWSGFNSTMTKNLEFEKSYVLYMPFINSSPSNYDTIYTSILMAKERCSKINQTTAIITYDQPLYIRAKDIVENIGVPTIVVRLGGFHLLMSFLGSIGNIMTNCGLKEAMCQVFASLSVDKILTGHAYARAVRAHLLIFESLMRIILKNTDIPVEYKEELASILKTVESDLPKLYTFDIISKCNEILEEKLKALENKGPTAALWIQYIRMVIIVLNFIRAERSSDWNLHLNCVRNMIPYFYASGHHLYAKASHLYLKDMSNLKNVMPEDEFERFTQNGFFAIRRSDRFWSGVWSDMTIEQTVMRSMKSTGGLTHGRGLSESVLSRWILGMVPALEICDSFENFAGIYSKNSEQHVATDSTSSRIQRDAQDVQKICDWFEEHPPFIQSTRVISISSGIVGSDAVTCHQAYRIGNSAMTNSVGKCYGEVKVKRSDGVLLLTSAITSVSNEKEFVCTDPLALFNRLSLMKVADDEWKQLLQFELAALPPSLFNVGTMRKCEKSALYKVFDGTNINVKDNTQFHFVIDGGFLIHRVVWPANQTYVELFTLYSNFVERHFGKNSTVIFDGYETNDIKQWERERRRIKSSNDITVIEDSEIPLAKNILLSSDKNKGKLITELSRHLNTQGIATKISSGDADTLIISTAILMLDKKNVVVVGEDVDLLVILLANTPLEKNLFFLKAGKGQTVDKIFSSQEIQRRHEGIEKYILFLHAISGCDTNSSIYKKAKLVIWKILQKRENQEIAVHFMEANAHPEKIFSYGEKFLLEVYNGARFNAKNLSDLRFEIFSSKSAIPNKFLLTLPPTTEAARFHIYRTYAQVQIWLGNSINVSNWGWIMKNGYYQPIPTSILPAPDSVMKTIFCRCTSGCGNVCSCRKIGLNCSINCIHCKGTSCTNKETLSAVLEDDDLDF